MRRIIQTGTDTQENHRSDFETCPSCDHRMDSKKWDEAATVLIMAPRCYKSNSVAVMAVCPKCGYGSWVHERMDGFSYGKAWPQKWKDAVEKLSESKKLSALREWGRGLCWHCKHLKSGTIDHHAWRDCIIGSGPAETVCPKFEPYRGGNTTRDVAKAVRQRRKK